MVAERTGIAPATLRAWEKRHGAIDPRRSGGSQRLYSDADIERVRLIGRLAAAGHSLADLARHTTSTLAGLANPASAAGATDATDATDADRRRDTRAIATAERLMAETLALDADALRRILTQSVFELGPMSALDVTFTPFLAAVGQAWARGRIGVAHEHLASAVVRDVLGWLLQQAAPARNAPALVATTVGGEHHEFGAMMASVIAAMAAWRVVYLGPNVPALELVRVAKDLKARVVLAGIVNPTSASDLRDEMLRLRQGMGARATILAGGVAAADHRLTLRKARIELVANRSALRDRLDTIWTRT